ncbi:Uncharacterised protein [Afipia felis]|uniref:Uncharacterized protein n=2 Tax=Afipia felis TaxID=1035 RepID=A0A380W686_AFIFE|nr:hypothetical protein HMPREF9697_00202 [Afipia felis ATCC 53690]SUU76383.1 Uncharacterised protein [Afipia felis]SUU84450.1 Uncharacterised protein [Afipia felis]
MVKVWGSDKGDDFTCPKCGSVYETELHRSPFRDSDSANCSVCHEEMARWNSTTYPVYTLKTARKPK